MSLERSLAEVYNRCGSGKSAHTILLTISSTDGLKRLGGVVGSPGLTEHQRQQFLKALNGEHSAIR